jgi:predicted RNA-binding Zn-ribbon protein involved in translation (DUF1610 family)
MWFQMDGDDEHRPASWGEDPHCVSCARIISLAELSARDIWRCPFCGGDLAWPDDQPREQAPGIVEL